MGENIVCTKRAASALWSFAEAIRGTRSAKACPTRETATHRGATVPRLSVHRR